MKVYVLAIRSDADAVALTAFEDSLGGLVSCGSAASEVEGGDLDEILDELMDRGGIDHELVSCALVEVQS